MVTPVANRFRLVVALILPALLALTGAAGMTARGNRTVQSTRALPLADWVQWSPFLAPGSFDMNRCLTLQAGDADGDGQTDLICPYDYGGSLTRTFVQYSRGNSFTNWTVMNNDLLNFDLTRCRTLQSGFVDTDDRIDLICPYDYDIGTNDTFVQFSQGDSYSSWRRNEGGVFDLDACRPLIAGRNSSFLFTGLICVHDRGNATTRTLVQYSNGVGFSQWLNAAPIHEEFNADSCRSIRVGDVNGDGRDDVICPYDYDNAVTATFVQLGVNEFEFTGWQLWGTITPAGSFDMNRCGALLVGDADGNGLADLICPYHYDGDQTRTFVQYSESDRLTGWTVMQGDFQTQFDLARCRTLQSGDINGDGRTDLLCPYDYGNAATTTFVQLSNATSYTDWQLASTPIGAGNFDLNRCRTLLAGDVNDDDRVDLICPYDYGEAATATFVQLSSPFFRVLLPSVVR